MSRYISLRGFLRISVIWMAGIVACGGVLGQSEPASADARQNTGTASATQTTEDKTFTLVGAGDIAGCGAALAGNAEPAATRSSQFGPTLPNIRVVPEQPDALATDGERKGARLQVARGIAWPA